MKAKISLSIPKLKIAHYETCPRGWRTRNTYSQKQCLLKENSNLSSIFTEAIRELNKIWIILLPEPKWLTWDIGKTKIHRVLMSSSEKTSRSISTISSTRRLPANEWAFSKVFSKRRVREEAWLRCISLLHGWVLLKIMFCNRHRWTKWSHKSQSRINIRQRTSSRATTSAKLLTSLANQEIYLWKLHIPDF